MNSLTAPRDYPTNFAASSSSKPRKIGNLYTLVFLECDPIVPKLTLHYYGILLYKQVFFAMSEVITIEFTDSLESQNLDSVLISREFMSYTGSSLGVGRCQENTQNEALH